MNETINNNKYTGITMIKNDFSINLKTSSSDNKGLFITNEKILFNNLTA